MSFRPLPRRAFLTSALAVGACAPLSQQAGSPAPGFLGPHIEADTLVTPDAQRLPLNVWPAYDATGAAVEPWAVIVGLHGMNDYAQAFHLAAPYWAARGVTTYAYDQRGFGRGPSRGVWGGQGLMTADLRTACALVRARHLQAVIGVMGESMGGAVAACAFASEAAPDADRLILSSPAVWGWSAQPLSNAAMLWIAAHTTPASKLTAPAWLARRIRASDNTAELIRMGRDRHMIFATRVDATYGLVDLMQAASEAMGRVRRPAIYLYGAHDQLIPKSAAFPAAAALARAGGRTAYYAEGYHLLTRDLHAQTVWDDVLAYLADPTAPLPSGAPDIPTRVPRREPGEPPPRLPAGG